jgi:predicted ester cyclase
MGADADLIRRVTEEVFVKGDVARIDELLAEDFESHDAPPGLPGTREGFKQLAAMVTAGASDPRFELDEYLETTDGRVVENWIMVAKHTGEMFGVPPSNQEVRVRGIEIWRCAGGKIVEHWGSIDMSDFFEKAGLGPA